MEQLYTYFNATNLSVFVASIVAIFSAYQALLLRKHNRLSVRPHITTWVRHSEKGGKHYLRLFLENNGLGTAIIKEFKLKFDGKELGANKEIPALVREIRALVADEDCLSYDNCAILGYGSSLRDGKEIAVVSLTCTPNDTTNMEDFEAFMDRFEIEVRYKSIYGEVFTMSSSQPPACA